MSKFRLGELFCGPGGIAYGAITTKISNPDFGIVHQWATDYDQDTCDTYLNNICQQGKNGVVCADIRKVDIEKDLGKNGDVDALAFGFPCNDYSAVGKQKGLDGDYGPLYSYGIKALKIFQPKWFLAENVWANLKSFVRNYIKLFASLNIAVNHYFQLG